MAESPRLATIHRYYDACNRADSQMMQSLFTADIVHYFGGLPPVRGAAELAQFIATLQVQRQIHWTVDQVLVAGEEAVIEWTMQWMPPEQSASELLRGVEWYVFRDGKIAELRAYDPIGGGNPELQGYPYGERG
ncbi:MAG: nuclear transport factor 2 family protein [Candidatus Binatia bacterium]